MENKDCVLREGHTVDQLFPITDRCKEWLQNNAITLRQPIIEMMKVVDRMKAEGFIIEVEEMNNYAHPCAQLGE